MVEHPNNHLPNQQNNYPSGDDDVETEDDINLDDLAALDLETSFPESEELESIDNQLDALNSALDDIEQKNDNILVELTELLNENREIRKQLQEVRGLEGMGNIVEATEEHKKNLPLREKNN